MTRCDQAEQLRLIPVTPIAENYFDGLYEARRPGDDVQEPAVCRLLVKGSLMEFYLDDILIESLALPANATGRIGLINAVDTMGTLKAWK